MHTVTDTQLASSFHPLICRHREVENAFEKQYTEERFTASRL